MKKLSIFFAAVTTAASAFGGSYSYVPTPADLFDLEHSKAYSWGIAAEDLSSELKAGSQIKSATLTISNIWDWTVERDHLFIDLLDGSWLLKEGVRVKNDFVPFASDYFNPFNWEAIRLADWDDPVGGPREENDSFNLVINFSDDQIDLLTVFLTNSRFWGQTDFGFGFDPDCHYFNDGVTFVVETGSPSVADGGMTLILLGLGLSSLVFVRRFIRV